MDVHVIMTLKILSNQHTVIEQVDHLDAILVNHKKTQPNYCNKLHLVQEYIYDLT